MGAALTGLRDLAEDFLPRLTRSGEELASKTEAGKLWASTVRDKIEPQIGKTRQNYLNLGMAPEDAMSNARKDVKDAYFGKNSQALVGLLQAAQKQGGPIAAQHLADVHSVYFRDISPGWRVAAQKKGVNVAANAPYHLPEGGEQALKDWMRTLQLPLISAPHSLQAPLNSLAVNGFTATWKAFAEYMRDPQSARAFAERSGAMSQELAYEMLQAQKKSSTFQLLLDPLKKVFNAERRFGIAVSAVSGKHSAMEAADTLFQSGGKDKASELQLKLLGLDPNAVMANAGRLSRDDAERAAFRSASEIMGYRSPLESPIAWEANSMARLGTLYKQYGYRTMRLHARMLEQAYKGGGLLSVAKQAALYATVFPIAGEFIKGAEGALTLRNPWDEAHQKGEVFHKQSPLIAEYIDALSMGTGFNLMYNATRQATHSQLADFLMGPVYGTAIDFFQDAARFATDKHPMRNVTKDVLRRGGLPGRMLYNKVYPPKNTTSNTFK